MKQILKLTVIFSLIIVIFSACSDEQPVLNVESIQIQTAADTSRVIFKAASAVSSLVGLCDFHTITPQTSKSYNDFANARLYIYNSKKAKVQEGAYIKIGTYPSAYCGSNNTSSNWSNHLTSILPQGVSNPFDYHAPYGNCVWWGWTAAAINWFIAIPVSGSASSWKTTLQNNGYTVSSSNTPNSICVLNGYNHVAFQENSVYMNDTKRNHVLVSEMNYSGSSAGYGNGMRLQLYEESDMSYITPPAALASVIIINKLVLNGNATGSFDLANTGPKSWSSDVYLSLHTTKNEFKQDLYVIKGLTLSSGSKITLNFNTKLYSSIGIGTYKLVVKTAFNKTYPALPTTWKYSKSVSNNQVVNVYSK